MNFKNNVYIYDSQKVLIIRLIYQNDIILYTIIVHFTRRGP